MVENVRLGIIQDWTKDEAMYVIFYFNFAEIVVQILREYCMNRNHDNVEQRKVVG